MIRSLEIEPTQLAPVDATERRGDAIGPGEGVPDGQTHIGDRELGDGGGVGELDHRMHDRLRMHDDIDLVEADAVSGVAGGRAEQFVSLDDLEALVHQRG